MYFFDLESKYIQLTEEEAFAKSKELETKRLTIMYEVSNSHGAKECSVVGITPEGNAGEVFLTD